MAWGRQDERKGIRDWQPSRLLAHAARASDSFALHPDFVAAWKMASEMLQRDKMDVSAHIDITRQAESSKLTKKP